ncbi:hypothetical protein ACQK5W_03880 [Pantoea sp. FN060301]|uniref:hypothetical protein n=1 Tax=Pantoea sp. FN060301 TaxID=3420380 RepID=UPI003D17C570
MKNMPAMMGKNGLPVGSVFCAEKFRVISELQANALNGTFYVLRRIPVIRFVAD